MIVGLQYHEDDYHDHDYIDHDHDEKEECFKF